MNAAKKLYAAKPKELYMPSQDSLSRRLGPVFAEVAALAARGGKPGLARAREMAIAHCAQHEPRL